jgi:nucleoside-diphosphate-sugar epimerase
MSREQRTGDTVDKHFSGRTCLITGGAGFLGSHLCQRLLHVGAEVVVFDAVEKTERTLLSAFGLTNEVEYVQGDIRVSDDMKKLLRRPFDFVFHLAAQPISGLSNLEPQTTIDVNAGGTKTLCSVLAENADVMVLASSACSYGIPAQGASPLRESEPLRAGFYSYTESKQRAEQELRSAAGLRRIIGRFVNVYGPGDRHFSRIIPRTIRQLLTGEPLTLSRGDGSTVLDFLYVDEAIDAFLHLAHHAANSEDAAPEVFNFGIGSANATSMRELVRKISETYDGKSRNLIVNEMTMEPPMVKFLDSTKAQTELKWTPHVFLDEGLRKTLDWYHLHIDELAHLEDQEYPVLTYAN